MGRQRFQIVHQVDKNSSVWGVDLPCQLISRRHLKDLRRGSHVVAIILEAISFNFMLSDRDLYSSLASLLI